MTVQESRGFASIVSQSRLIARIYRKSGKSFGSGPGKDQKRPKWLCFVNFDHAESLPAIADFRRFLRLDRSLDIGPRRFTEFYVHVHNRRNGDMLSGALCLQSFQFMLHSQHRSRKRRFLPQAPADSCGGLQSRARHAPPDRHRHAARAAGSPGDRHGRAFGAPGRYPTLAGRDFRMAPTHRGCALVSVTDHYHRQLLSGDHLHHGLLGSCKDLR